MIEKKIVDDFAKALVTDLVDGGYLSRRWDAMGETGQRKVVHGVRAGFRAVGVKTEGDEEPNMPATKTDDDDDQF